MNESIVINFSKWIVKLAYLNVLWITFTLVGFVLLGWAPATVSSFTVMRRWLNKEEFTTLPFFWKTYKKEFIKSNVSGSLNLLTLLILLSNIYILSLTENDLVPVFMIGNWSMLFLYSIFIVLFYPMYTIYKASLLDIYKKTLFVALIKLPFPVLMLLLCFAWGWVLIKFPGFILLFSVSVPIFLVSFVSYLFLSSTLNKLNINTKGEFSS